MKKSKDLLALMLLKIIVITFFYFGFLTITSAQNSIFSDPKLISADPDMISTMAACALDKNGYLHIVYVGWYYESGAPDDVASEIFYTNNLNGQFLDPVKLPEAELPFPPSFEEDFYYSKAPTIAVDLNGKVHVAYYRTETQLNGTSWICYTNNKNGTFSVPQILFYNPLVYNSKYYSYGNNIMLAADMENDSVHIVFNGNSGTGHGGARYSAGLNGIFRVPRTFTKNSRDPVIKIDKDGIPNILYWINSDTTNVFSNMNLATSKILGGKFSSPTKLFESNTSSPLESIFAFDQYDSTHIVFRYLPGGAGAVQMHYIRGKPGQYTSAIQLPSNTTVSLMYSIDVGKSQIKYIAYKQAAGYQSLGFMYKDGGGFKDISPQDYAKYGITSAGKQWFDLNKETNIGYFVYTTGQIYLVTVDLNVPTKPIRINIPNHAINVSVNPTFSWYQSARAITYHIQVSNTSDFSTIVSDINNIAATTATLSGLSYNTTYYWRINAKGAGGTSDWSDIWSFTTSVSTGATEQISNEIFRIYPVPVDGILKIDDIGKEFSTISIISQGGLLLKQIEGTGIEEIDVSDLKDGVYFIRISNSHTVFTKKIMKIKL